MRQIMIGTATALLLAVPAAAQEYDAQAHSSAMSSAGQVAVMENMRDGSRHVSRRDQSGRGVSANAAATCRNKQQAAANMGRNHPKVRQLYQLCAQAGF
jgi:hypothetical protein